MIRAYTRTQKTSFFCFNFTVSLCEAKYKTSKMLSVVKEIQQPYVKNMCCRGNNALHKTYL